MINVTKPFLPPKEEYDDLINDIWKRNWLTNNGPVLNNLELELKRYLDLKHLLFVSNGTIALQIAIKALDLKGEIITTPFSYVATTSSIVWERCNPVFVDIDKNSLNIDSSKIEDAITPNTSAILATHVYGNPCDVNQIEIIAKKHNLKVIYDAAHAFGVQFENQSIFNFGDISTCSTHATKLYHSIEGGLITTKSSDLLKKMAMMRNFGHDGPEVFSELGINGKNSEFHAAMGLVNLKHIEAIIKKRKLLSERYDDKLISFNAKKPVWNDLASKNYSYYPIIFQSEDLLLKCIDALGKNEIFGRRYFYPSLANSLPYVASKKLSIADDISKRIFCLPLYYDLSLEEVDFICRILLRIQNN